jgi:hypothetical protein
MAYVSFNPSRIEYSLVVSLAEVYTRNNLNWKQEYCPLQLYDTAGLYREGSEKTHTNIGAFLRPVGSEVQIIHIMCVCAKSSHSP